MNIEAELVAVLAVVGVASSLVLGVVVTVLALRLRTLAARQRRVFRGGVRDVVAVLEEHEGALTEIAGGLVDARRSVAALGERLGDAVSRVGVARYDAFEDMGGALSFSAALLDEHGDGVVISAINGRSETRCYAKPVVGGHSDHHLSSDEIGAIAEAMQGPRAVSASPNRRRRRVS